MASLSSSSTFSRPPSHDVFLSYRGEDTRNNFLCYLYQALRAKGIEPYVDSEELPRGEQIYGALFKAIEESKISVIVFSQNYATSSWCLDELCHIMHWRRSKERLVVPIFYHVRPSDVRKQTGSFAKAFIEHERNGTETGKIRKWRKALAEAGNLGGFHLAGNKPELEIVEEIVQSIMKKLSRRISRSEYKELVGIGCKVEQIKSLLCIGEEGVRMIGIWGMGGVGKTTLAKVIFEEVSGHFDSCCLMLNVRNQISEKSGEITLRNHILSALLNEDQNSNVVTALTTGSTFIKNRLRCKRVLVVLDDISDFEQFEKLEISHNHFGSGSRIIVTSRDRQVLANAPVDEVYEVKELNYHDSFQLFSLYAFRRLDQLVDDFRDLSDKFLEYAGGLPIALKTMGAALHRKNKEYWKSALNKLKEHPNDPRIFNLLKISFDGLDDVEKNIFLDMACFFQWNNDRQHVRRILDGCYDGMAEWAISNLVDKCLLTEDYDGLWMHDLVREMGREIVSQESNNPAKCSRLWASKDVCRVLESNMGTESIKGISLDMSQIKVLRISPPIFEKMVNLVFLKFSFSRGIGILEPRNKLELGNQDLAYLPDQLKYFHWDYYPSKTLPPSFSPMNLVELNLTSSNIEQLWNEDRDIVNLRLMDLRWCKKIRKIPNLSGATKLETLLCSGCQSLVELPCMTHLTSLRQLHLSGCPITKFPELATNIEELFLSETEILEVPLFIGSLKKLYSLQMGGTKIQSIPSCIGNLGALECINLNMTPIENLPLSIRRLRSLKELHVRNCKRLKSLSDLPPWLEVLDAEDCTSLERVSFTAHEYVRELNSISQFRFLNCFRLNQDARSKIVAAYLMIMIHAIRKQCANQYLTKKLDVNDEEELHEVLYCLPGSEIPDKFETQSRNSSITVKLRSASSRNERFLCFALCLVFDFDHLQAYDNRLYYIHCEYKLKGTDGSTQNFRREWAPISYKEAKPTHRGRSCEHVFVLFRPDMVHRDNHYKEASFDFYAVCQHYDKKFHNREDAAMKVQKCGVHAFYMDADSSSISQGDSCINLRSTNISRLDQTGFLVGNTGYDQQNWISRGSSVFQSYQENESWESSTLTTYSERSEITEGSTGLSCLKGQQQLGNIPQNIVQGRTSPTNAGASNRVVFPQDQGLAFCSQQPDASSYGTVASARSNMNQYSQPGIYNQAVKLLPKAGGRAQKPTILMKSSSTFSRHLSQGALISNPGFQGKDMFGLTSIGPDIRLSNSPVSPNWLSLGRSMIEDDANYIGNGCDQHPTTISRLHSKRNFSSADQGDYEPKKRAKLNHPLSMDKFLIMSANRPQCVGYCGTFKKIQP